LGSRIPTPRATGTASGRPEQAPISLFQPSGGWSTAAASLAGAQRAANEDRWLVVPAGGYRPLLVAVADGVGGEAAGERASTTAIEALEAAWRAWQPTQPPSTEDVRQRLLAAAEAAQAATLQLTRSEPRAARAATTLCAAALTATEAVTAHAGDSRAYLVVPGRATPLTADHTWIAEQIARGALRASDAARHPMRNVITRYLGQPEGCELELTGPVPIRPGCLLLCTDGLSNVVADTELAEHCAPAFVGDARAAVHQLLSLVAARRGADDATVIVCAPAHGASAPAAAKAGDGGSERAGLPGHAPGSMMGGARPGDPFGLRRAAALRRGMRAAPRGRRPLLLAATGAAVLAAAGGGAWLVPRLPYLVPLLRPAPLPAARDYLALWQAGRYDALYDRLSSAAQHAITREAFAKRHRAVAEEMTLTALTLSPAAGEQGDAVSHPSFAYVSAARAVVAFRASYTTSRFGQFERTNELPLVWERGAWRVDWSPAVLLPELTGGRLVRAFDDSAVRGSIVDRNGRPLAISQPGATPARVYPQGATAGPLVGYIGEVSADELSELSTRGYIAGDTIGKTGVEAAAEPVLAGQRGGRLTVITPEGNVAATIASVPPRAGETVALTLDLDWQRLAEAALGDHPGSVVIIDPTDGTIRALASNPRYDPNVFATGQGVAALLNDPGQPLIDRPVQGQYPPGSTFKVVTMAAALERGAFQPDSTFTCTGTWTGLPGVTMKCWLATGHGRIDLVAGLTQSCDVVFYELGKRLDELDEDYLPSFAAACGLGAPAGALPGVEAKGIVPGPAWKQATLKQPWTRGDTVNLAIGQGYLLVTPLQLATIYAQIAGGGRLSTLRLLDRAIQPGGNVERTLPAPAPRALPWSPATLQAVRAGLKGVVADPAGTASFVFRGSPLASLVAGKTGTAETAPGQAPHAWFACFAPFDAPKVAVLVMIEHGGEGSAVAAPIARRVLEGVLG
jgi:penicillin-binding protein 2